MYNFSYENLRFDEDVDDTKKDYMIESVIEDDSFVFPYKLYPEKPSIVQANMKHIYKETM